MDNVIVGGRYSLPSLEMKLEVEVVKILNPDEVEIKIITIIEIADTRAAKKLQNPVNELREGGDTMKIPHRCLESL